MSDIESLLLKQTQWQRRPHPELFCGFAVTAPDGITHRHGTHLAVTGGKEEVDDHHWHNAAQVDEEE